MGGDQFGGDPVQVEVLGVDQDGTGAGVSEHLGIEIGARVEHQVGGGQQPDGPHRQQVGGPRPGTDEVDGHRTGPPVVT